jgi:hypothetical protein
MFSLTFRFPGFPLPFLEMCEAVNSEKRYRTVKFVAVMRQEVDTDVAVKVAK